MDLTILYKIVAIGLLTAIASILLKKANREDISTIVSIVGLVMALLLLVDMLSQLYATLQTLFEL